MVSIDTLDIYYNFAACVYEEEEEEDEDGKNTGFLSGDSRYSRVTFKNSMVLVGPICLNLNQVPEKAHYNTFAEFGSFLNLLTHAYQCHPYIECLLTHSGHCNRMYRDIVATLHTHHLFFMLLSV